MKVKNLYTGLILLLMFSGSLPVAVANNMRAEDSVNVRSCFQSGNNEFVLFLQTLIWADGFYDGVAEPWNDVIFRNKCQAYDILSLIKQQQNLRQMIRREYMNCKNDRVATLKAAYIKTNMELYYARNLIDFKAAYGLSSDELKKNRDTLMRTHEQLYSEMKKKYLDKGMIGVEEFELLLKQLEGRYADRKEQYLVCEEGSWQLVKEKFDEFKAFFTEGEVFKKAAKKIEQAGQGIVETAKKFDENWARGLVQTRINDLSPEEFGEEFTSEFGANNPFSPDFYLNNFSQDTYFDALGKGNMVVDMKLFETRFESRLRALYLDTADVNSQAALKTVERLNEIVKNSLTPLKNVESCTEQIKDRQC